MISSRRHLALFPRGLRAPGSLAAILSLLLGAALVALALPRTVSAWASLEAAPAFGTLQEGQFPSASETTAGIAGLKRAVEWTPSGRRLSDLALLELMQALRLPVSDPKREALLSEANQHLVESLSVNPADGYAWFRLASVRRWRNRSGSEVADALMQ